MSQSHSRPMSPPVLKVISIPLLVDSICLHLLPRHIPPVLLVSKAFHAAFLAYRWSTLEACPEKTFEPRNHFPKKPSSKLALAFLRYGAKMAQHIVLDIREVDLTHAKFTHMDRMTELIAQANTDITRLRSLTTHGALYSRNSLEWMHWDPFLDDIAYDAVEFTAIDGDRQKFASGADIEVRYANLAAFNTALALTLTRRNYLTLQRVCLEGFINSDNTNDAAAFSVSLVDSIARLENLRSLQVGRLPLMDILNLILNLPSRVQELVLVDWMRGVDAEADRPGEPTVAEQTLAIERDWAKYQQTLREHCRREHIRTTVAVAHFKDEGSVSSSSSSLSPPTIRTLLKNMKVSTYLTRLCLSSYFIEYPIWVLNEILRRFPNIDTFKVPFILLSTPDDYRQFLPEERKRRIQHLDLSHLTNYKDQMVKILKHLKPAAATTNRTMTGLRSFTTLNQDDVGSGSSIRAALAFHYQSLTRISILGCGTLLGSRDVITLLECCPRLEVLLTMSHLSLRDRYTGELDEDMPYPTVKWTDFIPGDVALTTTSDNQDSTQSSGTTTSSSGSTQLPSLSSSSQAWPCAKTLKVLSIDFLFVTSKSSVKGTSFFAEGIYERLGQLENLEDLAIAANWIQVPLTPKRYPYYKRVCKGQHLPEPIPGAKYRARVPDSLSMSLDQGLGKLERLKKLRRLNISQLCMVGGIGQRELLWMGENWPSLELIPGLKVIGVPNWTKEEYDRIYELCPFFRAFLARSYIQKIT